jgi:hypothetical protein
LSAIPLRIATSFLSKFFRRCFDLSPDPHRPSLLSTGVRKRAFLEEIAPWLIWVLFFWSLAIVGAHNAGVGASTSNPRSLTQTVAPQPGNTNDCRGESLHDRVKTLEKR